MEHTVLAHALDGGYLCVIAQLGDLGYTRTRDLAVEDNVTRTAMALAAAHLTSRKQETVTKYLGQCFISLQHKRTLYPVDNEYLLYHAVASFYWCVL